MRLDKFLKVSRVIKRRTVANDAADNGRVAVKIGDIIEISFGDKISKFEVLAIPKNQGNKLEEIIKIL